MSEILNHVSNEGREGKSFFFLLSFFLSFSSLLVIAIQQFFVVHLPPLEDEVVSPDAKFSGEEASDAAMCPSYINLV